MLLEGKGILLVSCVFLLVLCSLCKNRINEMSGALVSSLASLKNSSSSCNSSKNSNN